MRGPNINDWVDEIIRMIGSKLEDGTYLWTSENSGQTSVRPSKSHLWTWQLLKRLKLNSGGLYSTLRNPICILQNLKAWYNTQVMTAMFPE
jgi:hypothetical protein